MKLSIEGVTWNYCEHAITRAVAAVGGTARVNVAADTVEVEGVDDIARLSAAIEGQGYWVVAHASEGTPDEAKRDRSSCHLRIQPWSQSVVHRR